MTRTLLATAAIALGGFALLGCGDDDDDDAATGTGAATTTEAAGQATEERQRPEKEGIEIKTADSEFGEILFDGEDQAIYLFDKESSDESECYGACAEAWPPVLTDGDPVAGKGAEEKLLGTTERRDGETQVTYDGHPLYYYVDDPPGEVLCHNVDEFGGLWLVVQPNGDPVS